MLQELTQEEVSNLTSKIHHFSYFNWVENSNSASTPFRLICTTSNQHSQTTMSIEQMTPAHILNNMEAGLIRFQLYAVPLVADIQGAYHCIAVDPQTALLIGLCTISMTHLTAFFPGSLNGTGKHLVIRRQRLWDWK